jgi:hypothetical protein
MTRDVLDDLFEMRDKARADAGDFTPRIESGSDYDSLSDEQPGLRLWRRFVDDGDSLGLLGFTQDEMESLAEAMKPYCRMPRTTKYCAKDAMIVALMYLNTNGSHRKLAELLRYATKDDSLSRGLIQRMLEKSFQAIADWSDDRLHRRVLQDGFIQPGSFGAEEFHGIFGAIDGTVVRIQKPSSRNPDGEAQRDLYSGKTKYHGRTALVVVNGEGRVLAWTDLMEGSKHDFRVLRESGIADQLKYTHLGVDRYAAVIGDSGFQGIASVIPGSAAPYRKPPHAEPTPEQLAFNAKLHSRRQIVERFFGRMKTRFPLLFGRIRTKKRLSLLIWRAAVGLTDLHIELNPLNDD